MASSDKMAASLISSDDGDGISKISCVLEGKISELLTKVSSENNLETGKTICASYTKAALLDSRRKLFSIAVKIEAEKAEGEIGGAYRKDATDNDKVDCLTKDSNPVLANRKAKPPVVEDVLALALYIKDPKGGFPRNVLKGKSNGKKKLPGEGEGDASRSDTESGSNCSGSDQEEESKREEGDKTSQIQRHFERFVIEEVNVCDRNNQNGDIPITVTALRDSGTRLRESPKLVSTASQTDVPYPGLSIAELRELSDNDDTLDNDMSRKRTIRERDNEKDNENRKVCENAIDDMRKRCEKSDKRMDFLEHEHAKEMSILRLEQSAIKDELKTMSKRMVVQKGIDARCVASASETDQQRRILRSRGGKNRNVGVDESWETDESTMMTLTQDSQGESIMTRISPAHATLNDANGKPSGRGATSMIALSPKRVNRSRNDKVTKQRDPERGMGDLENRSNGGDNSRSCQRCDDIVATAEAKRGKSRPECNRNKRDVSHKDDNMSDESGDDYYDDNSTDESSGGDAADPDVKRRKKNEIIVLPDSPPIPVPSTSGEMGTKKNTVEQLRNGSRIEDKPVKEKYSKIVTRNGWSTPGAYNKSPQKIVKKPIPKIAGVIEDETKELFVLGLSVKNFRTHSDLEESVGAYCSERKVETSYQRVITLKNTKKTVGCKITIRMRDIDKIYENDFWPRGVKIREWFDRKPTDRDRYFASSEESDDSKSK